MAARADMDVFDTEIVDVDPTNPTDVLASKSCVNNGVIAARIDGPPPADAVAVAPDGAPNGGISCSLRDSNVGKKLLKACGPAAIMPSLRAEFGASSQVADLTSPDLQPPSPGVS